MPTGYAAQVESGEITSLRRFALKCARGMMACVHMREDPDDAPIPEEFVPDPFYSGEIDRLTQEHARLSAMNENERLAFGAARQREQIKAILDSQATTEKETARYNAMIAKVVAWVPPSEDHEDFKRFMLNQLEISKPHFSDWSTKALEESMAKQPLEFYATALASVQKAVETAKYEYGHQVHLMQKRTKWIKELRASLPADEATP